MYPYLNEMIKKRGIKKAAIAQALGCSYSGLCRKLSGKSPLLWKDAYQYHTYHRHKAA